MGVLRTYGDRCLSLDASDVCANDIERRTVGPPGGEFGGKFVPGGSSTATRLSGHLMTTLDAS